MADTTDILKKVRKIELKTRGLSNQIFQGEYHAAFKGRGMAFSEVREYAPGDEIRTIDWNVTARLNHPYVKVFEEERELTVMILVDVSASKLFGSTAESKQTLMTEVSALIAFSAIQNNDKTGVIFFSDKIEKYIPPKKGRSHILRIIREMIDFEPESQGTNVGEALRFLSSVIKKRSIAFILSDFMSTDYEDALKIANRKHDVVALNIKDRLEDELPRIGMLPIEDRESGSVRWIDTNSEKARNIYKTAKLKEDQERENIFRRAGVDATTILTGSKYSVELMKLFKKREKR